jgi:hypothetical protein
MWLDASFDRWEVEGEARQRIKGAQREADQRRLAKLVRNGREGTSYMSWLSAAMVGLQRLAGGGEPKQRPAHP